MGWFGFGASFTGGVHPADHKGLTKDLPLETMPSPEFLLLPLQQHLGKPARAIVKKGDLVREGQLLAEAQDGISAEVRAPRSGVIQSLEAGSTSSGFPGQMIVLKVGHPPVEATGESSTIEALVLPSLDPWTCGIPQLLARVREAGIVGQGGAAFPTAIKLSPPPGTRLDTLIINGCECEPYLTRDYRLMLEQPAELLHGAAILARVLGVERVVIGIEDNKPAAIAALRVALAGFQTPSRVLISVLPLRTKYPQGAEKMLIEAVIGRKVPPGALPLSVGVVVQNVGTALAVREAVVEGRVQTDVVLTVSGRGIRNPANLRVPVGTPIAGVMEHCGGFTEDMTRVVVGGPMMGIAQHDLAAPVVKATSGILALTRGELGPEAEPGQCLRCAHCVEVCPIHLIPSRLARLSELGRAADARDQGIEVCMECGTCAFACPAHLPLVQWLRVGKQHARNLARSAS